VIAVGGVVLDSQGWWCQVGDVEAAGCGCERVRK